MYFWNAPFNPWSLEWELTPVTSTACKLTHSASSVFLAPAPVESSAAALLPSWPSSDDLPARSRALMQAPGWYSCKAGRSCHDRRVGYSSNASNEGATLLFLGPEDPNYLKTISLAAKNQPFFHSTISKTNHFEAKKKKPMKIKTVNTLIAQT